MANSMSSSVCCSLVGALAKAMDKAAEEELTNAVAAFKKSFT